MEKPRAIVFRTAGTNCDVETANALRLAGAETEVIHVNELVRKEKSLENFHLAVIPGGFADGDYIGSGKVFANKLKFRLFDEMKSFVEDGKLLWGICNGFQVLVKAGFLPAFEKKYGEQNVTLAFNSSGHFQDEWITIRNAGAKHCIYAKGVEKIYCPVNHGEGRFDVKNNEVLKKLYEKDLVVFKYSPNPNGSLDDIAGICDETGRIFGLMPHPEKNIYFFSDPRSTRSQLQEKGEGMVLFENAVNYAKKNLL